MRLRNFFRTVFLVDLLKGLGITFRYQHPKYIVTEQYPGEMPRIGERFRGAPRLNTNPDTGEETPAQVFVGVLGGSSYTFAYAVPSQKIADWITCHVKAFEFFGGVPARLVCDNLKTGVDKPDLYDPKINRAYAELATHYGTLIDPARAFKPKDKPRVERPMQYIRDSFWRGRQFDGLPAMQTDAQRWSIEVAGARSCRAWSSSTRSSAASRRPIPTRSSRCSLLPKRSKKA